MAPFPRISPHFTRDELTQTSVRDISNEPNAAQVANLQRLALTVLEPLREKFGPLYTTSGYRSEAVNRVIGGSATSAHCDGRAWDGVPLTRSVRWADVVAYALANLPIDQAIYEFGRWLHLGIAAEGKKPRGQALMIFRAGKYEPFNPADPRVTR